MNFISLLLAFIWLAQGVSNPPQNISGRQIILDMMKSIRNIRSIQFTITQTERIDGKLWFEEDAVKMVYNPLKIYIAGQKPDKGLEVLWLQGENKGDAWVHPNGFPYFTLSLNPEGKTMKIGHHSIFAIKFTFLLDLINHIMQIQGKEFEKNARFEGEFVLDNRKCYKVTIENPGFAYVPYTVMSNEDLESIAKKLYLSEYMILEKNPEIKSYKDVKAGQKILVPNCYSKTTLLFIDKETKLPLLELVSDDKGLFEKYEFHNMKVNPSFSDKDFSRDNPEYHF